MKSRHEDAIQRAVICHIQRRKFPNVSYFAVPNGGLRARKEAAIMQGLGTRAGVPDIVLIHNGQAYFLELKRDKGGRTSPAQAAMAAELRAAGADVAVCAGIDAAIAQLERWGLIRKAVSHARAA